MSNTQERIKKRREYLKDKGAAITIIILMAVLIVPSALFACLLLVLPFLAPPWNLGDWVGTLIIFFIFVASCWYLGRLAYREHKAVKQLPYIPPVTADTLPAEEVLVRGSEEPAQEQGKVLLRGTDSSMGEGEQELLRISQGQE